jgi:hypothetical protein
MKKLLAALTGLAALAPMAAAEVQFDILQSDMIANVACFDAEDCLPVSGFAHVTNLTSMNTVTVPIAVPTMPDGLPLAYQFVMQGDDLIEVGGNQIDYVEVSWQGPGFRYTYSEEYGAFEYFYFAGPANPPAVPNTVEPADGCYEPPVSYNWTWEEYPEGLVEVLSDFIVPDGETLMIDAGITLYAGPGVTIHVEGDIMADGTWDAPITFDGDEWAGFHFGPAADGTINHATFSNIADSTDGGALSLDGGADIWLNRCLIAHNSTTGMGGAAYLASGAILRLRSCTLSHNTASSGGNIYVADGGTVTGMYNLVTFGTPETMVTETGVVYSNMSTSCLYPLDNPGGGTGWYCDPGFADAANWDFTPSFWSLEDPTMKNCVIDASIIDTDVDPDGTPMDMGAVPFNQFDILLPAEITSVTDRMDDQGSHVMLHFNASPNDGSWINPITFYSVWVMYPGTDEVVATGQTVGALGQDSYTIVVPTLLDSTAANGGNMEDFYHAFYVSAHNSTNPLLVAISEPGMGYSIDNIAPGAVTGFGNDGAWVEDLDDNSFTLEVEWDASNANDFETFALFYTDPDNSGVLVPLGELTDTQFSHNVPFLNNLGDVFTYTIVARDYAGNESVVSTFNAPAIPTTGVDDVLPLSFALGQNYPNPFNPSTTVRYDLAKTTDVSLRVYNMQGQMVRELVSGQQSAGRYELVFNADNLASGVYVYHLQAGDFNQTRKMVLMK